MNTKTTQHIGCSSRIYYPLEHLANSLFFPLMYLGYQIFAGTPHIAFSPDAYLIISSGVAQAYYLLRYAGVLPWHYLIGNLIGPSLYSLSINLFFGTSVWDQPIHLAYWCFALCAGITQSLRKEVTSLAIKYVAIMLENMLRTGIVLVLFYLLTERDQPAIFTTIHHRLSEPSHQFITIAILFLGIITGIATASSERHLHRLSQITKQFKMFAEWFLGRELLDRSIMQPEELTLQRRERTIVFMDIRGFTKWSEQHTPEEVVQLLGSYYQIIEKVFTSYQAIKFKLSADEAMAIFPEPTTALQAAIIIRTQAQALLDNYQLGIGIGIHHGPVVEGLLGSNGVKFYDVIGDTVNTAKRLESAAHKGEIIISTKAYQIIHEEYDQMVSHIITVKGKKQPLQVYSLPAFDSASPNITAESALATP